jgi:hypothetical protein
MKLSGDGIVGDAEKEGHEEALVSYSQSVAIDMISNPKKNMKKLLNEMSINAPQSENNINP